jgi:hypothetical protein
VGLVELVSELENRWGSAAVSCCCEKLVAEASDSSGTQTKGECPPLEAATKQRLVSTVNRLRRPSVSYSVL